MPIICTMVGTIMDSNWKTDPKELAKKLVVFLSQGEVSIDNLDVRARNHGINGYTLDAALELLHKLPNVKRTVRKGTLWYSLVAIAPKKPVTAVSHVVWVRENYPWPPAGWTECFPEIDMSHIFMTREEIKNMKGRYIPATHYGR